MVETIDSALRRHFFDNKEIASMLEERERLVLDNRLSSFTAARDLLDFYFKDICRR